MKRLQDRDEAGVVSHHCNRTDMLIGFRESDHKPRVNLTIEVLGRAVEKPNDKCPLIIELGCAGGDISGQFADRAPVLGVDCRDIAVKSAKEKYPKGMFFTEDIAKLDPIGCDIVVLCEILEHLDSPASFVRKWLPRAKSAVISHPVDGDLGGDMSGGDHLWSFSEQDHAAWFEMGGHKIDETQHVTIGSYTFVVSRSTRL